MTLREKILEYLNDNNQQSIKQISEAIQVKENVIRTKLYEKPYGLIAKGIVVIVAHEGHIKYFSLKENATPPTDNKEVWDGFMQYNSLFQEVTKSEAFQEAMSELIVLATENLDFELIKKLEKLGKKRG